LWEAFQIQHNTAAFFLGSKFWAVAIFVLGGGGGGAEGSCKFNDFFEEIAKIWIF